MKNNGKSRMEISVLKLNLYILDFNRTEKLVLSCFFTTNFYSCHFWLNMFFYFLLFVVIFNWNTTNMLFVCVNSTAKSLVRSLSANVHTHTHTQRENRAIKYNSLKVSHITTKRTIQANYSVTHAYRRSDWSHILITWSLYHLVLFPFRSKLIDHCKQNLCFQIGIISFSDVDTHWSFSCTWEINHNHIFRATFHFDPCQHISKQSE